MNLSDKKEKRALFIFIFILAVALISAGGYASYRNFERNFRAQAESQLSAVAQLKMNALIEWREEQLADANFIYKNRAFSNLTARYLSDPQDARALQDIHAWLDDYQELEQYDQTRLLNPQGAVVFFHPEDSSALSDVVTQKIPAALQSKEITFIDFYRDAQDRRVYLTLLIPILDEQSFHKVIGFVSLRIDPQVFLHPYVKQWPVESVSAETLLVRREGNDVLYLSELNFQKNTALNLRVSLYKPEILAVKAALGLSGIMEGVDYRGVAVIGDARAVPNSPWFLITKMDAAEVYAPLRERLWQTVFFFGALIAAVGMGLALIWRRHRIDFYRAQVEATEALRESEDLYRRLFENMLNGFAHCKMIFNQEQPLDFIYLNVNNAFETLTGLKDVIGKKVSEVIPGIQESDPQLFAVYGRVALSGVPEIFETYVEALKMWFSISVYSPQKEYFVAVFDVITERKQAEEKIKHSETRYRRLFESAKDGILILDAETGIIVDVNPFLIDLLGYSHEAFLGKRLWDLGFFKDIAANEANFLELKKEKYVRYENLPLETADGRRIQAEFVSNVYQVDRGMVIQCNIRDVTERKLANEALRESEEKFSKAFQRAPLLMTISDVESGRYLDINDEFARVSGFSRDEAIGKTSIELGWVTLQDRAKFIEALQAVGRVSSMEITFYAKGKRPVPCLYYGELIMIGGDLRLLSIVQDITERKRTEEKSRTQTVALEAAANSIVITDKAGRIEWVNPAWSALTGFSKEEAVGKTPRILKSGKQEQTFYKKLWDTIMAGKVWRGELVNRRKDGSLYHEEQTITPVLNEQGVISHFIAVKQDIIARKQAERVTQARLRLNVYSLALDLGDFMQKALDEAEDLTESQIGFFHFVEDDQKTIMLQAWSTNTLMNMCNAEGKGEHYPVDMAGIWAETIRDQEPHIYNDYASAPNRKGMPEGHAEVRRFITVPLIQEGKVAAVLGVGNKARDYKQADLNVLVELLGDMWGIVLRKIAENALKRSNQRLQGLRLIDIALLGGESANTEALRHLMTLMPCDEINLIALDEISDYARNVGRAAHGFVLRRIDAPVSLGDLGLNEIRNGAIAVKKLTPDAVNSMEKSLYETRARSLLKSPLIVQGKLIGVLMMSSVQADFFTGDYLEIIKDVSAQLALSLHQANLLGEIRRHAEDLEHRVKERTAEIESTRQRLELAVNAGEIGVWEANIKEDKVLWDDRMRAFHGLTLDQFKDSLEAWWQTVHPQDRLQLQAQVQHALNKTGTLAGEYRILRPDGSTRYIAANAIVLYDADHHPERMIGVNLDVTERKRVEEAMYRANLEMKRALRVKDEFLANMSHELRTPLNAVMGISESLLEQTVGALNNRQQKYVSTIRESGEHLLDLINDILDLSKIEAGRMDLTVADVSIKSLWDSSFRMVKEMALKKNISIAFEADERAQTVRGDPRRLLQMLVNLLSNAVKFTPTGGRAGIKISAHPAVNQITFTVWDEGIGIAQEDISRLFQSFTQLDSALAREYSGTGLGLALVMQMARLHGGNVGVESAVNAGSRFTVTLPWTEAEQNNPPKRNAEKTVPLASLEKRRAGVILLMEDTEPVIMLVCDYLESRGYQVLVARDGLLGVEMAKKERPNLVLMDIQMPGMDGFEAVEELRADKALKDVPIIALTALAMPNDKERCLAAGMNDYMSKPIRLKELAGMVGKYMGNQ